MITIGYINSAWSPAFRDAVPTVEHQDDEAFVDTLLSILQGDSTALHLIGTETFRKLATIRGALELDVLLIKPIDDSLSSYPLTFRALEHNIGNAVSEREFLATHGREEADDTGKNPRTSVESHDSVRSEVTAASPRRSAYFHLDKTGAVKRSKGALNERPLRDTDDEGDTDDI